jgi:quercetin dioxygenase-like cupin family protein
MRRKAFGLVLGVAFSLVLLAGCGGDDNKPESPAEGVTQVERQLLQSALPATAGGQLLELTRVIIPARQEIASHTHPGPQLAVIVEGTLTYTVHKGEVAVTRAGAASAQTYGSGQTVELRVGDSLSETPGMVHSARNGGDTPVVIYLSSLFPAGAPPSSPVE